MSAYKEEADEPEPKVEDKVGPSPWDEAAEDQDVARRVAGWRDGGALSISDVKDIMREHRWARQEYRNMQKFIKRRSQQEAVDPLDGLPPTWQAFWAAVPHLNPQPAWRQQQKERRRKEVDAQLAAEGELPLDQAGDEPVDVEALLEEIGRLETEVRETKQLLGERERNCAQWESKLLKVRELDEQEAEASKGIKRKLEAASYEHGILEGKIRSSDIYFEFLMADTREAHGKKVAALQRSSALLEKQIHMLKRDVRDLLKTAAEALADHQSRTASFAATSSKANSEAAPEAWSEAGGKAKTVEEDQDLDEAGGKAKTVEEDRDLDDDLFE